MSCFGGLGLACWPLVPKFAGSNPAEAVGGASFGGEVKPSVPCRRFAAYKRSLNGVEVVISAKLPDNMLTHSSIFRRWDLSRRGRCGGTWWRKWERLNMGESNCKPPLRICPGCSVPEPYQSPDWALVSALTDPRAEYLLIIIIIIMEMNLFFVCFLQECDRWHNMCYWPCLLGEFCRCYSGWW
jgi:hypothetical protein